MEEITSQSEDPPLPQGEKKPLNALSASPDGNQIVAAGRDGMCKYNLVLVPCF